MHQNNYFDILLLLQHFFKNPQIFPVILLDLFLNVFSIFKIVALRYSFMCLFNRSEPGLGNASA